MESQACVSNLRSDTTAQFTDKYSQAVVGEKPEFLTVPQATNEVWSIDFMCDQQQYGRTFRLLNEIDDYNRYAMAIEIDFCLTSNWVICDP